MDEPVYISQQNNPRQTGILKQLSAGGARVQFPNPLRAGDKLILNADLGAGIRVALDAEVVYCERDKNGLHFMLGLRFLHIGYEGVPEVANFIDAEQKRRAGMPQRWQG